jgi:hypothetical protein
MNTLILTKNKKMLMIIAFIPVLMLTMMGVGGCEKSNTETEQTKIVSVLIAQGFLSGADIEGIVRQNLVIRDNESWQNLINQMNTVTNVSETFTETVIDFSEYIVIAVFDEVKSNGGWTIDIADIVPQNNQIVVTVTNLKTGDLTSVITQPYQIVKIPVSNKEIVFETFYKNIGE